MRILSCFHIFILFCLLAFFPGCLKSPGPGNIFDKPHTQATSHPLTIELDLDGTSYGHKLLFKTRTTGTNYQESCVACTDDMAYMASRTCRNHIPSPERHRLCSASAHIYRTLLIFPVMTFSSEIE